MTGVELSIAIERRAGERASKVIKEQFDQLDWTACSGITPFSALVDDALAALSRLDLEQLKAMLNDAQTGVSVIDFVDQFAAPLAEAVGIHWAQGRLPVFAEHLFSALLESTLNRIAERASVTATPPKVLLTTPSGETHTLGLAMASAVISSAGMSCLRLPSHMPILEISECAIAFNVRVVGLSVSKHYPPRLLLTTLEALRNRLPADVDLWLGGEGINRLKKIPAGVQTFVNWQEALAAFQLAISR